MVVLAVESVVSGPEETSSKPPAKVRVTFFESQKPHYVSTPESPDIPLDFISFPSNMTSSPTHQAYDRQESAESGLDNPFRPDGELSKEAETIVNLIKEGKPITPVKSEPDGNIPGIPEEDFMTHDSPVHQVRENDISPKKAPSPVEGAKPEANGSTPVNHKSPGEPAVVEVQHGIVVPPSDASQVEQVLIKKKPKCKCCVIQ